MSYDLIIIGGGPAGITAGIYAARQKLNTLLVAKNFGGQLNNKAVAVENYPGFEKISGMELIQRLKSHLKKQEIEIKIDEVLKIEKKNNDFIIITKDKQKIESRTVVIASGADPRPLEVPGEKEFIGRGVSYCVLCDGPIFKNKTAVVIGCGNAGFEAAIFLSNIAKKIYILESSPQIGAFADNQEKIKKTGKTEIIINAVLKEIKGDKFVKSIIYQDMMTKELKTLEAEGVFVEIGNQPATSFVKDLVDFNERDEIKVDFETFQTRTPGLFAAGDVNLGRYKQIVTACGEGAKAALAAYDYIKRL
jgi:thioredoxin-disulfide reductase